MMRLRRLAASFFDFGPDFFRAVRYGWRKILGKPVHRVVRVDWNIGDEIMAIPAYEALRKKYPSSRLRAEVRYPELLKHNPFLDSVGTDKSRFADRRIDLHGEDRGIPRMEYLKDRAGVDSWGVPRIYFEEKEKGEVCQKFGLGGEKLRIVLCPEASWYCRRWPLSYWFALSERLLSYHQPEICVVGTERVIFPKEAVNLAGKTTLRELAVLLSLSRLFVGCDSGPLHLAVASGVRSVGLFGPLNPDYLIAPQAHFVPLWANVDCRGCWSEGRMSNPDHCPKIFPDCMKSIPVEWVDHACRSLLEV
jgi:ADP-heptose:LPS heptosyltransferase